MIEGGYLFFVLVFDMILTLIVGCESLSLQSKYDKALRYCNDRSSFCHDL